MTTTRKLAVVAGVCFLVTHVTSIAALALYGPVLRRSGFVLGSGGTTGILVGGLLEVVLAITVVGTAVALFPVVRQHRESGAIAYVALRALEAGVILVGVVSLLAIVTLRQHVPAGADQASLVTAGRGLLAVHDWTFLLGPNFVCAADTFVLAYAMWRSRLVPRLIAGLGLVGAPLLFASATAVLFGTYEQVSALGAVAALPVFAWELSLALFLIVKGFRTGVPSHAPESREVEQPAFAAA